MKIPAAKIESFVNSPDPNINFVLLYGPDRGLISERKKTLSLKVVSDLNDAFNVVEFKYSQIKDDPSLFADEINAMSLMGGRRLIIVDADTTISKELCDVIEAANSDSFVIFAAGDLTPASTLRKFFDKSKKTAALPCYNDDAASIQKIIGGKLRAEGYNFEFEVVQYLADKFSGDRLIILNEAEKLILYMGDNKNITLNDVENCVFDSSEFSLDELCTAVASKDLKSIDKNMTRAISDGVAPVAIIRANLRYFMRLLQAREAIDNGQSEQVAMGQLRPPVFFKQVPIFKRQLSMWKTPQLNRAIKSFTELEIECKKSANPAELLCSRMLLILPLMARA